MKKILVLLIGLLVVTACGATLEEPAVATATIASARNTPASSATVTVENTAMPEATNTVEVMPTVEADEDTFASTDVELGEGKLVDSATNVTEASKIRPEDWVKGNADATVTVIEYGDFQ